MSTCLHVRKPLSLGSSAEMTPHMQYCSLYERQPPRLRALTCWRLGLVLHWWGRAVNLQPLGGCGEALLQLLPPDQLFLTVPGSEALPPALLRLTFVKDIGYPPSLSSLTGGNECGGGLSSLLPGFLPVAMRGVHLQNWRVSARAEHQGTRATLVRVRAEMP